MVTYAPGTIVRYSQPEDGEAHLTFVLVEDNGDRVVIESLDFPTWTVKPQEVVAKDQIVPVHA